MEQSGLIGVVSALVSTLTFGSTYVPLKWFDKGDGIFFQWVMSTGLLMSGCVVALLSPPTPLHPIAMLAGCFYSIGNSLTIYIMDGIGLAIGYLLWNTVTCVFGWLISRYGWFGTPQQTVQNEFLNVLGVIVVCIGGAIYAPIKHVPTKVRPAPWVSVEKKLDEAVGLNDVPTSRRIVCLLLTVFIGFLYGNFLTPINYVVAHEAGAQQQFQCYVLSYCMGSFVTSTLIFVAYCTYKRNIPLANPEICLPSIGAGILYGIAVTTFFMANQHLDQIIAYPILSKAPGLVVSLWAIFLFKEIQGRRNIMQLYIGIFVTLIGIILISLSKLDLGFDWN